MLEKILAWSNLQQAYLQISNNLSLEGKANYYQGWDAVKLTDLEIRSAQLLKDIQSELKNLQPISPAVLAQIPKNYRQNQWREIYIYNLKDRIKAQAIYQIVEPYFNNYFSPWLFSYRSSHPSYYAIRSTVRHYRKYYTRDWLFTTDLQDYSNYIQPDKLLFKIKSLGLPSAVNQLLALFIGNQFIKQGIIHQPTVGLIQGVPLIALFNNLYLDDLDKYCGPRSDFYRRVGDDLLIFDQKLTRLEVLSTYFYQLVTDLGLKINQEKSKLIRATESFNFLGYNFLTGQVRLTPNFYQQKINYWRQQFNYYQPKNQLAKIKFLTKKINRDRHNLFEQFKQVAEQKKLITDQAQVRQLSEAFFRILTRYFFGTYSPRHRRLLAAKLKNLRLLSLYKHFTHRSHASKKITN